MFSLELLPSFLERVYGSDEILQIFLILVNQVFGEFRDSVIVANCAAPRARGTSVQVTKAGGFSAQEAPDGKFLFI